jgi:Flp pilus assembly protein TadD
VLFKRLILENPDDSYSYSCCGLAYAGLGNETDAVIAGKTAVQLTLDDYLIRNDMIINLAQIYVMTGNYQEAIKQVEYLLNNPSWFSINLLMTDPSWMNLRETREFKDMTKRMSSTHINL